MSGTTWRSGSRSRSSRTGCSGCSNVSSRWSVRFLAAVSRLRAEVSARRIAVAGRSTGTCWRMFLFRSIIVVGMANAACRVVARHIDPRVCVPSTTWRSLPRSGRPSHALSRTVSARCTSVAGVCRITSGGRRTVIRWPVHRDGQFEGPGRRAGRRTRSAARPRPRSARQPARLLSMWGSSGETRACTAALR